MKYRIFPLIIAMALIFSSCALRDADGGAWRETCDVQTEAQTEAQAEAESETAADESPVDYEAIFAPVIDEFYKVYCGEIDMDNLPDGAYAVIDAAHSTEFSGTLPDVGYLIYDLSGDGVPELIIGSVPTGDAAAYIGTMIYALYVVEDGEAKCTLSSWNRSSYHVMDGGLFYQGSGSAAHSGYGIFSLSEDGRETVCEDFWFSFEYNGDFYDLRVWHNKVGEMDIGSSALLDMTLDEFEAQRSELRGRTYVLPLVHFENYVAE